jgi:hypothetical protein
LACTAAGSAAGPVLAGDEATAGELGVLVGAAGALAGATADDRCDAVAGGGAGTEGAAVRLAGAAGVDAPRPSCGDPLVHPASRKSADESPVTIRKDRHPLVVLLT